MGVASLETLVVRLTNSSDTPEYENAEYHIRDAEYGWETDFDEDEGQIG